MGKRTLAWYTPLIFLLGLNNVMNSHSISIKCKILVEKLACLKSSNHGIKDALQGFSGIMTKNSSFSHPSEAAAMRVQYWLGKDKEIVMRLERALLTRLS